MKSAFLAAAFACFVFVSVRAQVAITVDAGRIVKVLNGLENGVNLNYLMDGSHLNPSVPLAASLKNMGVKLLRYPGGEKSDNYLWSAAPWTAASPRMALLDAATCWPTQDARFVNQSSPEKICNPAVLDFDELMAVCRAAGAQPLIVVAYDAMYNTGTTLRPTRQQLIENAVEWVRYANIKKGFAIKYWMIGNESWNLPDYNGRTTAAQYATDLVDFATAMKAVDPTIRIIANGQSSWWPTLLQSSAVSLIDILAFSSYPVYNFTEGYETYRKTASGLNDEVKAAVRAINTYAPAADRQRLKVLASEYNSMDWDGNWSAQNNLGHALCNFQLFGDMVAHPKVEGACLWNTRWMDNEPSEQHIYDALNKDGGLNATGLAQQVWGKNLLQTMVAATSNNAFVKTYATFDTVTKDLTLFLLNKDTGAKKANLEIQNYVADYGGSAFVFSGTSTNDIAPAFSWAGAISSPAEVAQLTLPATSVTVIKLLGSFVHLPLGIHSFTAAASGAHVTLRWQAENETDLSQYTIERQNKSGMFDSVGIAAVQQPRATAPYTFIDYNASPVAPLYYRIKAVSKNSGMHYSQVAGVAASPAPLSVSLKQNMVQHQLQVHLTAAMPQTVSLTIVSPGGTAWGVKKVHLPAGASSVPVGGVPQLQRGFYWLQVQAGMQNYTLPFFKM